MKYLGVHKILIFLLVVFYTFLEAILFSIEWLIILVWEFKVERNYWSRTHQPEDFIFNDIDSKADKTIWHTIKRRYTYVFKLRIP